MIFEFGSGVLLGSRTDITTTTPGNFGLIQEVTLDMKFNNKELYGQYQFPVAIGRGTAKFTGKAKMAQISGLTMANLMFGQALAAGQLVTSYAEAHSVPASSVYTITVTNSATFVDDYGVLYAATGLPLTKVASLTAVGQYMYSAGVYTFYSGDASAAVLINYTYTISSSGQQLTMPNPLIGVAPTFQIQLFQIYNGKQVALKLYQCIAAGLSFGTKLEDFTMPEMDFGVMANAAGSVFEWSFPEVS